MCGRYLRDALADDVIKHFRIVDGLDYFDIHGSPSREIFPGEYILAVNHERRPEGIWWTIEDEDNSGTPRRAINAKSETVTKVRMFRDAFERGRVLIPATGFYEWSADRQRYVFTFDERLFALGGIARDCEIKGDVRRCGVILTTDANEVVRPIHAKGRMPVVIHSADYDKWLDPDTGFEELRRLMQPLPAAETHAEKAKEPTRSDDAPAQSSLF